jgi:hypothetical protein
VTVVPRISEATAKRQVSAAKAVVTRYERQLDEYDSWSFAPQELIDRHEKAVGKLRAAERRLDAVRSQEPARHSRAWSTSWLDIPVTPEEDEAFAERARLRWLPSEDSSVPSDRRAASGRGAA